MCLLFLFGLIWLTPVDPRAYPVMSYFDSIISVIRTTFERFYLFWCHTFVFVTRIYRCRVRTVGAHRCEAYESTVLYDIVFCTVRYGAYSAVLYGTGVFMDPLLCPFLDPSYALA